MGVPDPSPEIFLIQIYRELKIILGLIIRINGAGQTGQDLVNCKYFSNEIFLRTSPAIEVSVQCPVIIMSWLLVSINLTLHCVGRLTVSMVL